MKAGKEIDRRTAARMPIEREVQYRVLNRNKVDAEGRGRTLNISSRGVLFSTQHMLVPGWRVEITIDWPAQLNEKCALKLVARGRVVRFDADQAAIEILQYEFRTRRRD